MYRFALLSLAILLAAWPPGDARAEERRGRNRPILRLKSEFPIGTVRQLAFSQEGRELSLYAAGDDKVVRRWKVSFTDTPTLQPAGQFHWPIYLADRGNIHAMSVIRHPAAGELLAIGGVGYTPPLVAVIPVDQPDNLQTLLDATRIAQQPVRSLAFGRNSTTGDTVVVVGESYHSPQQPADVVVWKVNQLESPELLGRCKTTLRSADLVSINPGGTHFVVAGMNFAGDGSSVEMWDIGTKSRYSATNLKSKQPESLFRGGLGWTANDAWVCGSLIGPIPSTFPADSEVFFGGTYAAIRGKGANPNAVQIRNSTGAALQVDAWEDGKRAKPHQRGVDVAAGESTALGAGLPGLFVDALINGKPEAQIGYGCPKGSSLEFQAPRDVAAMALIPGNSRSMIVGLREPDRIRLHTQTLGGPPVLLDPDDEGFRAPQREPMALAVSPDGKYVAAAGLGHIAGGLPCWQIRIWELATAKRLVEHPPRDAKQIPVSGPMDEVAVGSADHATLYFRRGKTWKNVNLAGRILGANDGPPETAPKETLIAVRETSLMDGAKAVGKVPAGSALTFTKSQPGWHQVTFGELAGWVQSDHVILASSTTRSCVRPERPVGGPVNGVVQREFTSIDDSRFRTPKVPHPFQLSPNCGARLTWPGNALDLLAVGYDDGILIWDLRANPPKPVRSFYSHESPVTCLAFAVDGRLLVTGAADGTISGWRVDGWQLGNELGVTLNGATVASVVERSPGWEAGFVRGQTIASVNLDGVDVPREQWKTALEKAPPGKRLTVTVGGAEPLITPVSWDPIWTYAPRYDGDWVFWTPQGQLETKATLRNQLGTELPLEWQVGLLRNRIGGESGQLPAAPRIFDAGVFLRMNADRLASSGDPTKTMGSVLDTAVRSVTPAPDDSPQFPDVDLRIDSGGGKRSPRVTQLSVKPPTGYTVERVDLWLNSFRIAPAAVQTLLGGQPLDIAPFSALRSGENNVVAVTTVRDSAGNRNFFQDVRRFSLVPQASSAASRIHFIGCGVARVDPALKLPFPALDYPGKDVVDVRDAFQKLIPKERQGTFTVLADGSFGGANDGTPTGKALIDALGKLAAAAQTEDVAIIMLAGHGDINKKNDLFEYIAVDGPVAADKLHDVISRLRCRTVLLLDTCHSAGVAGAGRQLQDLSRLMPGPVIITSCGRNEQSVEHSDLKNGFFTAAIKEALTGTPPEVLSDLPPMKREGPLTVTGLFDFVERRTPQYLKAMTVNNPQTPQRVDSLGFSDAARFRLD